MCLELLDADARDVRDRIHRHADRDALDLQQRARDVVAEIGLRQHDTGSAPLSHAVVMYRSSRRRLKFVVEPGEQECSVDVRCKYLLIRAVPGPLADERAAARLGSR
jgi:hypothetical protein